MKVKLIALVSIVCLFINLSISHAGTWIKKTSPEIGTNNSKTEITPDKTPETSKEGLYTKHWADGNDIGLSITGWVQRIDKKTYSISEIQGGISDVSIRQRYQWSERNPPRAAFSINWTEVLYVQNKGNCDNSHFLNNHGTAKAYIKSRSNFMSGPERTFDNYTTNIIISAENQENKIKKSPKVDIWREGKQYNFTEPIWDDEPDKKKSWLAAGGDIVSYSVGMDNRTSDNIITRGAIGANINVKLHDNAKNALAGIFHEISGYDLVMDSIISDTNYNFGKEINLEHLSALGKIKEIWYDSVSLMNLSSNSRMKVGDFLSQIYLEYNPQRVNRNLLIDSIKQYIERFSYTFDGETEEQACYYLAWLIAKAAARPDMTGEDVTNTRVSFENLIEKLTNVLEENAKQAIRNTDSPEIQEELSENLAKVKGRLLYYFYELSKDPLFPAFKEPIGNDIEAEILKIFENEKILYNLLNNQIKTEPESEFYKKWLTFYFDRVAERVVFWLVVETNKDTFRNPKYWGGMHYRAQSIRNGTWPVEIYLTPINDK